MMQKVLATGLATNACYLNILSFILIIDKNYLLNSIGKDCSCDVKAKILICDDEKRLKYNAANK